MRSPSSTLRTGGRAAPRRLEAPHPHVDASALALIWSRATLGTSRCSVAVFVADRSGRLRSVSARGPAVEPSRRLSAARRAAFRAGRPHLVDRRTGRTRIACLPLLVDGQPVGVLQVSAGLSRIDAQGSVLVGVADAVSLVVAAEHRLRPVTDPSDLGLAWTAHELKGPLLGILALLDRSLDGHRDVEQLRRAERSLSDMIQQIDALLLPPGDSHALRKKDVDLVDLAREAIDRCEVEFGESRVVLHAPESLRVLADPVHLVSAISNVVRNALAYSDPDEKVEVTVEQDGGSSMVRVLDHGPGIPPEYVSSLFDPFVRGERGRARKHGTGLGLFIANRVIDLHGGRIDVESRPARTTVELRIPTGHRGGHP